MPKPVGFLKRKPEKINVQDLHDGGFLLSSDARKEIELQIQRGKKGNVQILDHDKLGRKKNFSVYFDQNGDAFALGSKLGEGAFGKVFLAQNVLTGKWYCMKRLKQGTLEEAELDLLKQEGMYRSDERMNDSDLFIGELIHGKNLSDLVEKNKENRTLSFEQALALNISLVEAYENLQRKNYVHRDIKPANVMVDMDQQKCIAIDFGFAKKAEQHLEQQLNQWVGTPLYITIDVLQGKPATLQDDIYAIGLTAGEILSSRHEPVNFNELAQGALSEQMLKRREYVAALDKAWQEKDEDYDGVASIAFEEISHVILGAEHEPYQKEKVLSNEEIQLCKLIFKMTSGKAEDRPTLEDTLNQMRKIRFDHVKNYIEHYKKQRLDGVGAPLVSQYMKTLASLFEKRNTLDHLPHLQDDLDAFLLKMIDKNEVNRPALAEAQQYQEKLNQELGKKQGLRQEIYHRANEEYVRLEHAKSMLDRISIKMKSMEHVADPIVKESVKNLIKDVELLQTDIAKRKGTSIKNEVIFKRLQEISKRVECFDQMVELKKIINQLKESNKRYLEEYDKKNKQKVKRTGVFGVLIMANTDQKYQNAVTLKSKLDKLLKDNIINSKPLEELIQTHLKLDKSAMGLMSKTKSSKVAAMFSNTKRLLDEFNKHDKESNQAKPKGFNPKNR